MKFSSFLLIGGSQFFSALSLMATCLDPGPPPPDLNQGVAPAAPRKSGQEGAQKREDSPGTAAPAPARSGKEEGH